MDGPPGPCTAATIGPGRPPTALNITTFGPPSHRWSPITVPFTGVATLVAKYCNRSNFHSTNISRFYNLVSIHDLIFANQQL